MAELEDRIRDLELGLAWIRGRLNVVMMVLSANLGGIIALLVETHK